jgi:NAD(P)-dependent dehydrogenase (short-subunit alcohol dehydrogenase family)
MSGPRFSTAIVTGGAAGIGRAIAERLARDGAAVMVADLDGDEAAATAATLGGRSAVCDVGSESDVTALVERTEAELGPVDLFVSNAGVLTGDGPLGAADRHGLWNDTPDRWQLGWQVNVMAHVYAARALVPRMTERGGGHFITVASAAGLLSQIGDAMYSVTKHAAVAFAESLAITHGDDGIRVTLVCPQAVDTALAREADSHADRSGNAFGAAAIDGVLEPADVANAAIDGALDGRFLVLPHPGVADYIKAKTADYDRWIGGMRKLRRTMRGG